jgi:hypothetical protein
MCISLVNVRQQNYCHDSEPKQICTPHLLRATYKTAKSCYMGRHVIRNFNGVLQSDGFSARLRHLETKISVQFLINLLHINGFIISNSYSHVARLFRRNS